MVENHTPPFILGPEKTSSSDLQTASLPLAKKETKKTPREVKKRKRGAQPGNANALKYGFYARRLPNRDLDGLDATTVNSLKDEIEVMRIFSRKVAELGSGVDDLDKAIDLLRVLSLSTSSINRLVRTHTRIPDPELNPADLLRQALTELEEDWPEYRQFCDAIRNNPHGNTSSDIGDS